MPSRCVSCCTRCIHDSLRSHWPSSNYPMITIRSKFCQIVFSQPRRILNGLQTKTGFNLSPQASPLISLTRSAKPIAFEADAGKVLQPRRNKTEQKKGIDFMEDDDNSHRGLQANLSSTQGMTKRTDPPPPNELEHARACLLHRPRPLVPQPEPDLQTASSVLEKKRDLDSRFPGFRTKLYVTN